MSKPIDDEDEFEEFEQEGESLKVLTCAVFRLGNSSKGK